MVTSIHTGYSPGYLRCFTVETPSVRVASRRGIGGQRQYRYAPPPNANLRSLLICDKSPVTSPDACYGSTQHGFDYVSEPQGDSGLRNGWFATTPGSVRAPPHWTEPGRDP